MNWWKVGRSLIKHLLFIGSAVFLYVYPNPILLALQIISVMYFFYHIGKKEIHYDHIATFSEQSSTICWIKRTSDLKIVWMNQYCRQVFGEIINKTDADFFLNKEEAIQTRINDEAVINSCLPFKGVEKITVLSDKIQYWLVYKYLLKNNELACIAIDVTNIKTLEEELRRSNEDLMNFAYIASHDLKSPLRGINNLVTWIEEDIASLQDVTLHVDKIKTRIKRMDSLIDGLLEYSKIGRTKIDKEWVEVNEIIDNLDIEVVTRTNLPKIHAQKTHITQVFANLIENAVKHHPDPVKAQVKVECYEFNDYYLFSVEDNGVGIAPEYRNKIFQIFQTLQSKDKTEGTGMGLTIVKKIIEQNKGCSIWVENLVSSGAKFTFQWPKNN